MVRAAEAGEVVENPILLVRGVDGRQMAAQIGRPAFRDRPVRRAEQIIIMAGGGIEIRPGHAVEVCVHGICEHRHFGEPLDERLRANQIRRINPAFHREAAAGADIERGALRNLDVGVRAGKFKLLAGILEAERLPDCARRKIEAPDQLAVVRVFLRIGTVQAVALAAPPAVDARAAEPERDVVNPARHRGDVARDGAVGEREQIRADVVADGIGRIGDDADLIVGQHGHVGDLHELLVGEVEDSADRHEIRRHRPAAKRVGDIRHAVIQAVRRQFKIAEREVGRLFRKIERRLRELDRHIGQIRIIGENEILVICDRRAGGVSP